MNIGGALRFYKHAISINMQSLRDWCGGGRRINGFGYKFHDRSSCSVRSRLKCLAFISMHGSLSPDFEKQDPYRLSATTAQMSISICVPTQHPKPTPEESHVYRKDTPPHTNDPERVEHSANRRGHNSDRHRTPATRVRHPSGSVARACIHCYKHAISINMQSLRDWCS